MSLDACRFLAALFIVIYHAGGRIPDFAHEKFAIPDGWIGTNFFIMLSGFVITRSYAGKILRDQMNFKHYFLKRVLRIYPCKLST